MRTLPGTFDIPVGAVQRIRCNLIESGNIFEALERIPKDLEDARKVSSKVLIQGLQELIDLPNPTRLIPCIWPPWQPSGLWLPIHQLKYVPRLNKITSDPLNSTNRDVNRPWGGSHWSRINHSQSNT